MTSDITISIQTAQTRTRINTFFTFAGLIIRTVLIEKTLWSTVGWWANHARKAWTVTSSSNISSWVWVLSTWIWLTGIFFYNRLNWQRFPFACCEWISNIVIYTSASWHMVHYPANSIDSTCSRIWINAFVSLTCFVWWTIRLNDIQKNPFQQTNKKLKNMCLVVE